MRVGCARHQLRRREQENRSGIGSEGRQELDWQAEHKASGGTAIGAVCAAVAVRGAIRAGIVHGCAMCMALMRRVTVMVYRRGFVRMGLDGLYGHWRTCADHEVHRDERHHQDNPGP